MNICDLKAYEIAALIKSRELSAVEVLEANLDRISNVDGRSGMLDAGEITKEDEATVHAFISVSEERARKQAADVDKRIAEGEQVGPLTGVPFSVKDIFAVKGTFSTAASRILANFNAPYTATAVKKMEKAGGVMLGKVNLDEFTYGSSSESSAFQPHPRNPWDTSKVTGGSSGGSAAAVAAGEGALSLGTDTGGSIRQPAAFCGVVGMKPTYGRVSRYGLIAFGSSLDCPGPVSRDVRDAALMMNVIAGPDHKDNTTAVLPVPDYLHNLEAGVKGMRIGLSSDYFKITYFDHEKGELQEQPIPDSIKRSVEKTADALSNMGAEIVEDIQMPYQKYGIPVYFVISRVEAASNLHRFDGVKYGYRSEQVIDNLKDLYRKTRNEGFGQEPKLRILMGMYVSAAQFSEQYYQQALRVRSLIRSDFDTLFDANGKHRVDALLTPTTPSSAFPIGDVYGDSVLMQYADQFTVNANHAGLPSLTFPAGLDDKKMPLGAQLIGPDFSEAKLLRIARAYEITTDNAAWRSEKPQVLKNL